MRLRFGFLGHVWHFGPLRKVFAPPECVGASQFFYACCNIVFGTHEEPLGIYCRNGLPTYPFHGDKRLRFGCLGQVWHFGPLRRCLLLLNVLVLPNSSTHVATLCLGPMRSLWAYIEGMDGLHIHFMVTNGSDLADWARFGT